MMERFFKNQNANETDYDKQFKEDLEKATALSLETLALEEFHRNKSGHLSSATDISSTSSAVKFSSCKLILIKHLSKYQFKKEKITNAKIYV